MSNKQTSLQKLSPIEKVDNGTVLSFASLESNDVKNEVALSSKKYVDMFNSLQPNSPDFKREVNGLNTIGQTAVERLAKSQSNILNRKSTSYASAKKSGDESRVKVTESLMDLSNSVEALMPDGRVFKGRNKFLKAIPFIGDPLKNHLEKFDSSADHLKKIVIGLEEGKKELIRDNEEITKSQQMMWNNMRELAPAIYEVQEKKRLFNEEILSLEAQAEDAERSGESNNALILSSKANAFKSEVIHALNQREIDLHTQLTVGAHAYLSYDLAIKNNEELIKGIERAQNTTILSLETAVTLAEVLNTQSSVVGAINSINETTNALIKHTGEQVRGNALAIREQASSSGVDPEILRESLMNIKETIDEISSWKIEANEAMEKTIEAYEESASKAFGILEERLEAQNLAQEITDKANNMKSLSN